MRDCSSILSWSGGSRVCACVLAVKHSESDLTGGICLLMDGYG